jgi:uncharacterized protein
LERKKIMDTQSVGYKAKACEARNLAFFFLIALLLIPACARQLPPPAPVQPPSPTSTPQPQPARVEEITFQSGSFKVVGDLKMPGGKGPFPVVLFVHGSGPADRTGFGSYLPIMARMLQAGYATFSWDKPGTGESTGTIDDRLLILQRAQIILDAIDVLKARADINSRQIGLWGISQAGYVMPQALSMSEDIAFMICDSCPAMPGYDQMAFQITAFALCKEVPETKADDKARLLTDLERAQSYETYDEYLHYREVLEELANLNSASTDMYPALSESDWLENPPLDRGTWNPIKVIEQTGIPVLAIFGDRDRQIDPLQGAYAYRKALEHSGNPLSRVELFPNANHGIAISETGCPDQDSQWFDQYVKNLGYGSVDEALAALQQDPDNQELLSAFPFAPGYLDLIEEWLRGLPENH